MASSDFRAWRMEKAKTAAFCGKALEDALARHGKPEVLNTDKGSQFTGAEASLGGEQDDHSITERVPGAGSKNQEVVDVANGEYFRLLASALR